MQYIASYFVKHRNLRTIALEKIKIILNVINKENKKKIITIRKIKSGICGTGIYNIYRLFGKKNNTTNDKSPSSHRNTVKNNQQYYK